MLKTRHWISNIYHCCIHKSASQWVPMLFTDPRVLKHTGMPVHRYEYLMPEGHDPRRVTARFFDQPFPRHTVVSPIYIDYPCFARIPKPRRYRAIYIMRDPRDVVVSYYFSWKTSHPHGSEEMLRLRRELNQLSLEDGLVATLQSLVAGENFVALRSWRDAPLQDPRVRLFRYEDLVSSRQLETVRDLFAHCRVRLSGKELADVLRDQSFERISGRPRGQEDERSHFRKGIPGDWRNYFTESVARRMKDLTGDLVTYLGYDDY